MLIVRIKALPLFVASVFVLDLAPSVAHGAWPNSPFTNLLVCTAYSNQYYPTIVSDDTGGAIVTWEDYRSGTNYDIYAQHLLASGAVDPAWPPNGRALCTAASDQQSPTIVSDGAGGAIVAWFDLRNGNNDIYAQHVLANGAVDPAWTTLNGNANGTPLCIATGDQVNPTIVSDGTGGAIVTWQDLRSVTNYHIYAQHVLASGAVDPTWTTLNGNANGTPLCTATNDQRGPTIVSDGAGGAIVTWSDGRSATTGTDIYAQHVLASGAVDPAWTTLNGNANGTPLCTATNYQYNPTIVSEAWEGRSLPGMTAVVQPLGSTSTPSTCWRAARRIRRGLPRTATSMARPCAPRPISSSTPRSSRMALEEQSSPGTTTEAQVPTSTPSTCWRAAWWIRPGPP